MAARITFVAVAVMCTFGALNAKPEVDNLSLKLAPNDVIAKLEQVLAIVDSAIATVQLKVNEKVTEAMDKVDKDAANLAAGWNAKIDELAQKATEKGLDIADCLAIQKQLPPIVDQIRAQTRICVETEQQNINENVDALEALNPQANAILQDAEKDVAQCDQNAGNIANILCLSKALWKQEQPAAKLALEATQLNVKILAKLAGLIPNVAVCTSENSADAVAAANEVATATVTCIRSKMQN